MSRLTKNAWKFAAGVVYGTLGIILVPQLGDNLQRRIPDIPSSQRERGI